MPRRMRHGAKVVKVSALLLLVLSGSAEAKTCSDRLEICHGYCAKSMSDSPRCHAKCSQLHDECMASGCWESKIVAKQCGFTRQ